MTNYTAAVNNPQEAVKQISRLSTDDQLALLWFVYEKMGDSITPAAPGSASPDIARGLFNQVKEKSQNEQLQIQRDLVNQVDNVISREYGSLSANSKLAFWYYLAQGMEDGTIIPMPDDYDFPEQGRQLLAALETMDFEQQITVLRNTVIDMGTGAKSGAEV